MCSTLRRRQYDPINCRDSANPFRDRGTKATRACANTGVSESAIVEQALDLLDQMGDTPNANDYWFSVAAMREDWDVMLEDWM